MKKFLQVFLICLIVGCKTNTTNHDSKISENLKIKSEFINAIKQADVKEINNLLSPNCKFKEYPNMNNWYSFYRDGENIIGPFPLEKNNYLSSLNLKSPKSNPLISNIFFDNFPIYFDYSKEKVIILGQYKTKK